MRETITIQVGQCGNRIGSAFWEAIASEHGIDPSGVRTARVENDRVGTFFEEATAGRFVPRSVLVDLDPAVVDVVRAGAYGALFRPDNFIFGRSGTGNNWAKGHYGEEGKELQELAVDRLRKEAERCDALQCLHLVHSLGGGTGSGLGTSITSKLREIFPDRLMMSTTVFPATTESDVVVDPYNVVLSLHQIIENFDASFCLDNGALRTVCQEQLKLPSPTDADTNHLIVSTLSDATCGMRFPGQLNMDLRKMVSTLLPFPRMHFLTASLAPLKSRESQQYQALTVPELTQQLFDSNNVLASCNPSHGRYMAAAAIYRGDVSSKAVEEELDAVSNRKSSYFVEWIPQSLVMSLCDIPPKELQTSAALIGNNTSIRDLFRGFSERFSSMFRRKAFLHHYNAVGMDEMEFTEAETNLNDLCSEYIQYQDASAENAADSDNDEDGE